MRENQGRTGRAGKWKYPPRPTRNFMFGPRAMFIIFNNFSIPQKRIITAKTKNTIIRTIYKNKTTGTVRLQPRRLWKLLLDSFLECIMLIRLLTKLHIKVTQNLKVLTIVQQNLVIILKQLLLVSNVSLEKK